MKWLALLAADLDVVLGIAAPFSRGTEAGHDAAPVGLRRVPSFVHRSASFGAGPGAFHRRRGTLLMSAGRP
jgi:hypothetical protein